MTRKPISKSLCHVFFIISFEILALIAMLRSPFIHYWFNDIHSGVANWMLENFIIG